MLEALLTVQIFLLLTLIGVLTRFVWRTQAMLNTSPLVTRLETRETLQERAERGVKEEIAHWRQESADQARGLRGEVQGSLRDSTASLMDSVDRISVAQQQRLEDFTDQLNALTQGNETAAGHLRSE